MINYLRTLSARLITRHLHRPRALVVRAWFWLAAQTSDLSEKRRCLEAILALEPGNQWARAAMEWVEGRMVRTGQREVQGT